MPIVVPAVNCHPIDLLSRPPQDAPGRRWLVACTMPRQEKSLARELFQRGVPFYLPLLAKRLLYKRRSTKSYLPLFSGFVFLYANDQERAAALETGRVSTILEVPDQAALHQDLMHVESTLRESVELASGAAGSHNGSAGLVENTPLSTPSDSSNGNHSPHSTEHALVMSVGFLRQNMKLETNDGHRDGTPLASVARRKPLSL